MPPVWLQLLALALQTAPTVEAEVEQAIHDHWGKDHVQQLAQGAEYLSAIAGTIANAAAVKQQAVVPELAQPHAPGTPTPSFETPTISKE